MKHITLITGGARSGKSSFALKLAEEKYQTRVFVATAAAMDDEMKNRISNHQKERGNKYHTYEEQITIVDILKSLPEHMEVAVIDCITVWIGNLFYKFNNSVKQIQEVINEFISYISCPSCNLIFVTNEVGNGIIPENSTARLFRDIAGSTNSLIARKADSVYICFLGIPQKLK
jgi:adenosylcobinamide kinase/adenosylcobinamide-phosphate guanylyltransferase